MMEAFEVKEKARSVFSKVSDSISPNTKTEMGNHGGSTSSAMKEEDIRKMSQHIIT